MKVTPAGPAPDTTVAAEFLKNTAASVRRHGGPCAAGDSRQLAKGAEMLRGATTNKDVSDAMRHLEGQDTMVREMAYPAKDAVEKGESGAHDLRQLWDFYDRGLLAE